MKRLNKKNNVNCKSFPEHKCNFYKKEFKKLAYDITNIICQTHNLYFGYSSHIFHRELAEKIIDYIKSNPKK